IAAVQAIYGADYTTRSGNTVYGFNCTADRTVFDFTQDTHPIFSIWDGGGIDTLDCSLYNGNQTIDLTPGNYSSVDGMISNVGIAFNCTIENAIGGGGNDTIIGNTVANMLTGGGGNDTLNG